MSTPVEQQRVVGPSSAEAISVMAHQMMMAYLSAREAVGVPMQPMAWVVLGDAEDGKPVALRVAPPTHATIVAAGGRLTFVTVSESGYIQGRTRSDIATVQSYMSANGGVIEGYPGLEIRIIAIVHGPGGRMWSSARPPKGEPWHRPAIGEVESFASLDGPPPPPSSAAEA